MEMSDAGLLLLKRSEGFRSATYRDVAGLETIGYGHRLRAGESFPNGITEAQGDAILAADVASAEASVQRLVQVPLAQGQFDALVDFVFNLGAGNLASSTLLRELNAGDYDSAAAQILRWDHVGTQENAGLKARREAEFQMFTDGAALPDAAS